MDADERGPDGRFPKGVSGNPGGRPRKVRELDTVLEEHLTPENMRGVLEKLREFALAGQPGAMKVYLDRLLGPVQQVGYMITLEDIPDAPDAVLDWFRELLKGKR